MGKLGPLLEKEMRGLVHIRIRGPRTSFRTSEDRLDGHARASQPLHPDHGPSAFREGKNEPATSAISLRRPSAAQPGATLPATAQLRRMDLLSFCLAISGHTSTSVFSSKSTQNHKKPTTKQRMQESKKARKQESKKASKQATKKSKAKQSKQASKRQPTDRPTARASDRASKQAGRKAEKRANRMANQNWHNTN